MAALVPWAFVTGALVFTGHASEPFISLALGFVGAAAIVAICALLAQGDLLPGLRYCGENSLVIYLAFFLPMAAVRVVLIHIEWILDAGTISLLVTIAGNPRRTLPVVARSQHALPLPVRAAGALPAAAESQAEHAAAGGMIRRPPA